MPLPNPGLDLEELINSGYRYALALCHDAHLAADLLQDAWLSVLKAQGQTVKSYLFSAIRSRFIDRCRRPRLVISHDYPEELLSASDSPELNSIDDDDRRLLQEEMGKLRESEREALFLMVVDGMSASDAATIMDCPRGSVLSLVHRAKQRLREGIERGRKQLDRTPSMSNGVQP